MIKHFNLDKDNNVVECSMKDWESLYTTENGKQRRRVGYDDIDGTEVSTVFLGMSACYNGKFDRMFETAIFYPDKSEPDFYKYRTYKQSEEGHKKLVEWVKNGCKEGEKWIP